MPPGQRGQEVEAQGQTGRMRRMISISEEGPDLWWLLKSSSYFYPLMLFSKENDNAYVDDDFGK